MTHDDMRERMRIRLCLSLRSVIRINIRTKMTEDEHEDWNQNKEEDYW